MKAIVYSKDALKALGRIPANVSRTIRAKMALYATDPSALANNVKALKGQAGVLRLRVGDWRVLFTESGEVIAVIRITVRGDAYE